MEQEQLEHYQAQQAIAQQQIDGQAMQYAPQLHEQVQQNQSILVAQTNPKKIVREIILRLRGCEEKPDGSLVKVADEKLNKEGVDNIWFILDSHINQNVILSHLDEKEISNIMNTIGRDLVRAISLNSQKWGIKNETDKDIINNSIMTNIYLALKRAEGQNEKNWLGKISMESISPNSRLPTQKKGGFLSKLSV